MQTELKSVRRYYVYDVHGNRVSNAFKTWGRARNRARKMNQERGDVAAYHVEAVITKEPVQIPQRYQMITKSQRYSKETNDCTVIATALVTGEEYKDAHAALELYGRKPGHGIVFNNPTRLNAVLGLFGFKANPVDFKPASMQTIAKQLDPAKKYLVFVRGHVAAVVGGVVEDWSNGRKHHVTDVYEIVGIGVNNHAIK